MSTKPLSGPRISAWTPPSNHARLKRMGVKRKQNHVDSTQDEARSAAIRQWVMDRNAREQEELRKSAQKAQEAAEEAQQGGGQLLAAQRAQAADQVAALDRLGAAVQSHEGAVYALGLAVRQARSAGISWDLVAAATGLSRDTARRRYGAEGGAR